MNDYKIKIYMREGYELTEEISGERPAHKRHRTLLALLEMEPTKIVEILHKATDKQVSVHVRIQSISMIELMEA